MFGPKKPGETCATPGALVPRIDTRSQGVLQAESDQEENRKTLISGIVRALLSDLDRDKFIEQLQSSFNKTYTYLSEDAKRINLVTREY